MKHTLGIRTHLIAGIVITTLAAIGLIGVLSLRIVENNALLGNVRHAETIARFVTAVVSEPRVGRDLMSAQITRVLSDVGIRVFSVSVTDGVSGVLVEKGVLPEPEPDKGTLLYYDRGVKIRRYGGWLKDGPDYLYVSVAAAPGRSSGLASAEFVIALTDLAEEMNRITRFILFYALADSVIVILLGIYFLSRAIIDPLKNLEAAASRIAGGSLGERAEVVIDNEIGGLARAFNTMAERLENEIKRLERVNRELVDTQHELLRSSTLATVGRLAAGIAHEIGNPLGAVQGYLDILQKGMADKDEEAEILVRTDNEISRISQILREFLDFSRPPATPPEPVDVNRLLKETVAITSSHDSFKGVKIEMELDTGLRPVIMDEGKLRQVFLNLLINAAESIDDHGVVTVSSSVKVLEREGTVKAARRSSDSVFTGYAASETGKKPFVAIAFRDTGSGISIDEMDNIFDPFFTTKTKGGSVGLGLFVCNGIVENYGGSIDVESSPGEGSLFTVLLPAA